MAEIRNRRMLVEAEPVGPGDNMGAVCAHGPGRLSPVPGGWSSRPRAPERRRPVPTLAPPAAVPPVVEIRVLGGLDVHHAGRTDHPRRGRTGKGRTLLAMLAVAGGSVVTTDRIIDALWPHPPRQSTQNVATLVSRLRADLGRAAVLGGPTGYRLAPTVDVDLNHAATLVDRAGAQLVDRSDTTLTTAVAALHLLARDTVLPEYPDADWARPARDWHAGLLRRARSIAARSAVAANRLDLAAAIAHAAIRDDPLDEAAYRALMAAYLAADEPSRAVRAYHRLRTTLDHELGLHPTPATQHLLVHVLRYGADHA